MTSKHETLIGIATVSQRLVNTLDRCVGRKTVESSRLDKIVVGSRTVLEALNRTSLLKDGNADDRLVDWLNSEEPQACLRTLNQMEEILNRKVEYGVKSLFFKAPHAENKISEAIRLFQMRKSYFHFLLMADIWNRESGAQKQSSMVQPDVLHVNSALRDGRGSVPAAPCRGGDPSNVVRARMTSTMEGKQEIDLEKLDGILEWLNGYNSKDIHKRTSILRQPDTCTWLPNTPQYKRWRNTDNSFLWLHGKPGAGKSVLAASVIEGLKSTLQGGEVLVFFYCDFRNERSTTAAEVIRSILSQLLQQFRRHVVDPGDLIDSLVEERDEGASTIDDAMLLARYISRAAKRFSLQPFLVIDALDECKDVDLPNALKELQKGGSGIRIFVTSRPLPVIKDAFSGLPSISMDVMHYAVSADIQLHTRRELDSHRRLRVLDPSLKNEIYSALCERANGMFRLVQCQLDALKQCATTARVREALKNLPKDLHTTYERILLQINDDEEGKIVRRVLDWLLFSLCPLELCQIMEILSIDLGQRVLDRDSGPVNSLALLDALGSLVMYDEMTDVVILSHYSVKEYLMAKSTRTKHPRYHIDERDVHTQLALLCMCYISVYLERSQPSEGHRASLPRGIRRSEISDDGSDAAIFYPIGAHSPPVLSFESHPFLEYVLYHGFRHLAHVNRRITMVLHAIETLQSVAQRHSSEWERLCERDFFIPWPTLKQDFVLYILIAFAPEALLRSFVGEAKLRLKDETNPLIYAAYFRKVGHARTLLSAGVSLDRWGWDASGFSQALPLEVAVRYGDRAVVDLFLTEARSVPHDLFVSALERQVCHFPARNVARLLQTDEFVEWAADDRDEELLLRASDLTRYPHYPYPSQQDIDIIQRRLIQIGCDPSAQRFDETSLRDAARVGHISTVKQILSLNTSLPSSILLDAASNGPNSAITMIHFLLSIGCCVDVVSPMGDTPLHRMLMDHGMALENECLKCVKALTGAGCSPSARNEVGDTPLHFAARCGYTSIVEYFLSLPILLPPDILLAASMSSAASMIRLLVDKGANVHAISANGNNPLHIALGSDSGKEHMECAEILINAGCNLRLPNARGETPIDIAAKNGHLCVVEHLLSMGLLWSPSILLSVTENRSLDAIPMIKLLVSNGANIHVTRPDGYTALHLAIKHYWETECLKRVQILVNAGCDVRACNLAGKTPFHIAAMQGFISVMEYLLSLGISIPSDVMLTQFEAFRTSSKSIYFLLNRGGDIHTVAGNGDTLLHLAAMSYPDHDALRLAKFLVHAGCNPCTLNSAQETPLHIAARNESIPVIKYLLSLDVTPPPDILLAASESRGHSADKNAQTIQCLLDRGANVSAITTEGDTPLHLLLTDSEDEDDCLESVKILIDAGCDPCSRNLAGETPLHAAARSGFTTILKYLLSLQGVPLPHDIFFASNRQTIRFLFKMGIDLPSAVANCDTELMYRALGSLPWDEDCQAFAESLIDLGWDLSSRSSAGETPIHIAARRHHIGTVKYLHSQNIPLPSDVLLAAVAGCESRGPYDAVPLFGFLIREGAGVNIADSNGDTPLHLTLCCKSEFIHDEYRHWKLIDILLDGGSDPSARNVDGQTPFDLADANGHFFKENFSRLVQKSRVCA